MKIQEYTEADFAQVKCLHDRYAFDSSLPSLSSEAFFYRRVIREDNSIRMASFMRHTSEIFLVCDPKWFTPAWRLEAIRQLDHDAYIAARANSIKGIYAFISPKDIRFQARLIEMGWGVEPYPCVSREVL